MHDEKTVQTPNGQKSDAAETVQKTSQKQEVLEEMTEHQLRAETVKCLRGLNYQMYQIHLQLMHITNAIYKTNDNGNQNS